MLSFAYLKRRFLPPGNSAALGLLLLTVDASALVNIPDEEPYLMLPFQVQVGDRRIIDFSFSLHSLKDGETQEGHQYTSRILSEVIGEHENGYIMRWTQIGFAVPPNQVEFPRDPAAQLDVSDLPLEYRSDWTGLPVEIVDLPQYRQRIIATLEKADQTIPGRPGNITPWIGEDQNGAASSAQSTQGIAQLDDITLSQLMLDPPAVLHLATALEVPLEGTGYLATEKWVPVFDYSLNYRYEVRLLRHDRAARRAVLHLLGGIEPLELEEVLWERLAESGLDPEDDLYALKLQDLRDRAQAMVGTEEVVVELDTRSGQPLSVFYEYRAIFQEIPLRRRLSMVTRPLAPDAPTPRVAVRTDLSSTLVAGLDALRTRDYAAALANLERVDGPGSAIALRYLALIHARGMGVKADRQRGVELLHRAGEADDVHAQMMLAHLYSQGQGDIKADPQKVAYWYRKAADQGLADAQFEFGLVTAHGRGVTQDIDAALNWYRQAAAQGHRTAQWNIGMRYRDGQAVEQDLTQAFIWHLRASLQGSPGAQANLGWQYRHGEGIEQDHTQALKWYRRSAEAGHAPAQVMLGNLYQEGEAVVRDPQRAVALYREAAKQGDGDGILQLGLAYLKGIGVASDIEEGVRLIRKAADLEVPDGQYQLARLYARGLGVKRNLEMARLWYRQALELGHPDAAAALEQLEARTDQ